ncbi:MAG: glycosyltransferase family 2 protein [Candidatus Binatia bacterium]
MDVAPRVTVFISVCNREHYVAAAIESILVQSFTNFELLLIDDGSTDRSREVMQSYTRDSRVRLVCNNVNLGIPKTRNKSVALARGKYLAMLDSDDIAYPTRLEKQVEFLDHHPDYAVVGTWTAGMDAQGRLSTKLRILPVSLGEVQARLLFQCCPAQSSIMARTTILREYEYREDYVVSSDFDLWVRLAKHYKLGNLPTVLVRSRMHGGRITQEKAQLVKEKCLAIISPQLTELGITFTPTDLERHFLLLRMSGRQFIPDREYLQWADAWLGKLQEANRHTVRCPEQPFARLLGQIWCLACWQAAASLGWAAWRYFWQSPLSKELWPNVKQHLFLRAFKRSLWDT